MGPEACASFVINQLPLLSASYYVKHFFKDNLESVRGDVSELVHDIETSFVDMIKDEVDWMVEDDKNEAIEKAQAIEEKIGYPKELLSVDDLYPNLVFNPISNVGSGYEFFANILKLRKYERDSNLVSRCNNQYLFE